MGRNNQKQKRWLLFEGEVRQLVEAFGYAAEATQPSHDFGVDVIATNQRRKVIIQCKLYGGGAVGGDTIMKLVGSREYFDATDTICITTSHFTRQAQEIAAKQSVHLIDGEMLIELCRQRGLTIPSFTVLEMHTGKVFAIGKSPFTLGREDGNDLVIKYPSVSRHHALLERAGMRLTLCDGGSKNGTFANGTRITPPVVLNYDDRIRIGPMKLFVRFSMKAKIDPTTLF